MADNRQRRDANPRPRHAKPANDQASLQTPSGASSREQQTQAQSGVYRAAQPSVARPAQNRVDAPVGAARYGSAAVGVKRRGPEKKKGGPWRVIFWVALIVFIGALITLGVIAFSYWQGQDKYNAVATQAFEEPADIASMSLSDVVIDWDALRAINPDTVGWVYVPDTKVNYPITHTTNNDKYLTTDFLGEKSWLASYGSIFLAAENTGDFSDANSIVYGHHMNDGSMFAQFADFRDEKTFNEHRTVYIFTPTMNYKLTTFSLVVVDASDPLAQPSFADEASLQAYVQDKMDRSVVAPNPASMTAQDIKKMFTFVTCSDYTETSQRIVLFASVGDSVAPLNAEGAQAGAGDDINPADAAAAEDAAKEIA
ncbi:MAG: class B sortase [Raoultibacter sp.]